MKDSYVTNKDWLVITAITHFLWAANNLKPEQLIAWAYPNWDNFHPDYQDEKLGMLKRDGLELTWFRLDAANRKNLTQRIEEHYSPKVGQ